MSTEGTIPAIHIGLLLDCGSCCEQCFIALPTVAQINQEAYEGLKRVLGMEPYQELDYDGQKQLMVIPHEIPCPRCGQNWKLEMPGGRDGEEDEDFRSGDE